MTGAGDTLATVLRGRAETSPTAPGLAVRQDGSWRTWSWEEYFGEAQGAASGLRELGIAAGDHVLVLVLEPDSAAALILGSWLVGAVPIQIGVPYRLGDPGAFLAELEATARRLRARLLVVSDRFASETRRGDVRISAARDVRLAGQGRPFRLSGGREHDVALIQLTSGSTGRPRGVVVGHDELLRHMESMSRALPVARPGMKAVSWLPLHHDMGLIGGLLFPLFNDFPIHLMSPADFRARPFAWLEALSELGAGITPGPPSAYALAVRLSDRARDAKLDLSTLECAMIGAEQISPQLIRSFSAAFAPCGFRPEAFFPVYGLAEATVAVTFPPLLGPTRFDRVRRSTLERTCAATPSDDESDAVEWVGVGSAIPDSEIRITDDAGTALGERTVGEIQVRSSTLFRGYFDEPEQTAEIMVDGWLKTGDLGYVAEGALFVTGRKKDVIIKGGHNIAPQAVEEVVAGVDGVRPGCVVAVGIRAPELETEEIWVVAETKLDVSEHRSLSHRIRDALKTRGMAVDQIRLVDPGTLPKTTSGKLKRAEVRAALAAQRRHPHL